MGSEGWPPVSFLEVVAASAAAATEDSKPRPLAGFDWATENMQMMMLVSYQQQLQLQHQASSCSDWGMRAPILGGGGGVASRTCNYIGQPQSSTTALLQSQLQSHSRHSLLRFGSDLAASQVPPPSLSSPRSSSSSCQVSGCQNELLGAKHYHRRHRVCQYHSKAATVQLTSGSPPHRFCQQCSRFHPLAEFDNEKRSCRKRLADHNKRRRKTHIDPNIKLEPALVVPTTANHGDEPTMGIETKHGCKALMTLVSNLEADTLSTQNHNQNQSHAVLEKGEELYSKTDARSLSWLRPELEKSARSKATTSTSFENLQKPGMESSHWILRASVNNSNNKHGLDHNYMGLRLHDIKPSEQVQPQHVNLLYNHCHRNTFP